MFKYEIFWYKYSDYRLDNNMIVPVGSEIFKYNPFDYFDKKRKQPKVAEVNYTKDKDELNIHECFVNIDVNNPEEMVKWVKEFGIPYSKYEDNDGKIHNCFLVKEKSQARRLIDEISVDEFRRCVIDYRDLIKLYDCVQNPSQNDEVLRNIVYSKSFQENYAIMERQLYTETTQAAKQHGWDELLELWDNTPRMSPAEMEDYDQYDEWVKANGGVFGCAKLYIDLNLEYMTQDVREKYTTVSGKVNVSWSSPSLLGLLYKMIILDWTRGKSFIKCKHKYCYEYFIPGDDGSVYCSKECRNRGKQMDYRKAHREEIALKRKERAKAIKKLNKSS